MRFKNSPSVNVVKREQKQQKIDQFVKEYLRALRDHDGASTGTPVEILLFARSPASPVAKAVAAQSLAISEAGIALHAVFSQIGAEQDSTAWTQPNTNISFARDIALVNNPALLDAHEQLVLNNSTSWMGDCLRREPTSSDAYECYALGCELSARSGKISFERLWKICKPVACHEAAPSPSDNAEGDIETVLDAAAAASQATSSATDDNAGPLAGTSH